MRSLLDDLLHQFLMIGGTESEYLSMTISAVNRRIKAFNEKQKEDMKIRASMDIKLAALVATYFSGKSPDIDKMYPFLNEERSEHKTQAEMDRLYMARIDSFVHAWNNRR